MKPLLASLRFSAWRSAAWTQGTREGGVGCVLVVVGVVADCFVVDCFAVDVFL